MYNAVFFRYLTRHDLLLWPTFRLSFPSVQTGPISNTLVFTRPTMTTSCHMTHVILPIISEDDHKRHQSPTKCPTSPRLSSVNRNKSKTIVRTLQPTSPPNFLLAYVPKVHTYIQNTNCLSKNRLVFVIS